MNEVGICNLALSHVGDQAQVTSISPPDGSQQAALCAQFYPVARDVLLESSPWRFTLRRIALAEVTNPTINNWVDDNGNPQTSAGNWQYAYAVPSDCVTVIAVLPPNATDDYEESLITGWVATYPGYPVSWWQGYVPIPGVVEYVPQPYALESLPDGTQILLTNVEFAILRYSARMVDTTRFPAQFKLALSYQLASMLAGPILKGSEGIQVSMEQLQLAQAWAAKALAADGNQRKIDVRPSPVWIKGR